MVTKEYRYWYCDLGFEILKLAEELEKGDGWHISPHTQYEHKMNQFNMKYCGLGKFAVQLEREVESKDDQPTTQS